MLVLARHVNESIIIGENIVITVLEVRGDKVRLGIEAPKEVEVHREEIAKRYRGWRREEGPDDRHGDSLP